MPAVTSQANIPYIEAPQREGERLFKQQADGLFNVFELHWLTQREKEEKGERGESRQVGCVNTRLMVCSLKSVFNSVHLLLLYKRNNEVVMKRDKHRGESGLLIPLIVLT